MEIEVRVSLIDLKRAFRRLLARLSDEAEAGGNFIVFSASGNSLDIVLGGTSEVLRCQSHGSGARQEFRIRSFVALPELYGSIAEG